MSRKGKFFGFDETLLYTVLYKVECSYLDTVGPEGVQMSKYSG